VGGPLQGKIRADVVHEKLLALGYTEFGADYTLSRYNVPKQGLVVKRYLTV